jgi:hypothetical protein
MPYENFPEPSEGKHSVLYSLYITGKDRVS